MLRLLAPCITPAACSKESGSLLMKKPLTDKCTPGEVPTGRLQFTVPVMKVKHRYLKLDFTIYQAPRWGAKKTRLCHILSDYSCICSSFLLLFSCQPAANCADVCNMWRRGWRETVFLFKGVTRQKQRMLGCSFVTGIWRYYRILTIKKQSIS